MIGVNVLSLFLSHFPWSFLDFVVLVAPFCSLDALVIRLIIQGQELRLEAMKDMIRRRMGNDGDRNGTKWKGKERIAPFGETAAVAALSLVNPFAQTEIGERSSRFRPRARHGLEMPRPLIFGDRIFQARTKTSCDEDCVTVMCDTRLSGDAREDSELPRRQTRLPRQGHPTPGAPDTRHPSLCFEPI